MAGLTFFISIFLTAAVLELSYGQWRMDCNNAQWIPIGSRIGETTCLYFSEEPVSYVDAMVWCDRLDGGHLVEISSLMMNTQLTNALKTQSSKAPKAPKGAPVKYWIGLSDMESEQVFKWVHGRHFAYYLNFAVGKGAKADRRKNCVSIDAAGSWHDEPCKTNLPFICQK